MTDKKAAAQGILAVWTYISSRDISFWEKFFVIGLVLLYVASPVDLIPDTPVIGWLDDIGIGAILLAFCNYRVSRLANPETDKDVIDVTPVDKDSEATDKRSEIAPRASFSFFEKEKTSDDHYET